MEENGPEELKAVLIGKYWHVFLSRLTPGDLRELQLLARGQAGSDRINPDARLKLEFRLRQYFPEDVLRREIASIESLLIQLDPADLDGERV